MKRKSIEQSVAKNEILSNPSSKTKSQINYAVKESKAILTELLEVSSNKVNKLRQKVLDPTEEYVNDIKAKKQATESQIKKLDHSKSKSSNISNKIKELEFSLAKVSDSIKKIDAINISDFIEEKCDELKKEVMIKFTI